MNKILFFEQGKLWWMTYSVMQWGREFALSVALTYFPKLDSEAVYDFKAICEEILLELSFVLTWSDRIQENKLTLRIFQDPASAIPKGTLLALAISMVSYAAMVLFSGASALRDASGNLTDLVFENGTVVDYSGLAKCVANNTCQYGLHNSYSVSYTTPYMSIEMLFNK